jgi:hypothetical protein
MMDRFENLNAGYPQPKQLDIPLAPPELVAVEKNPPSSLEGFFSFLRDMYQAQIQYWENKVPLERIVAAPKVKSKLPQLLLLKRELMPSYK